MDRKKQPVPFDCISITHMNLIKFVLETETEEKLKFLNLCMKNDYQHKFSILKIRIYTDIIIQLTQLTLTSNKKTAGFHTLVHRALNRPMYLLKSVLSCTVYWNAAYLIYLFAYLFSFCLATSIVYLYLFTATLSTIHFRVQRDFFCFGKNSCGIFFASDQVL